MTILSGLAVLVTRPLPAGALLCDVINSAGGQAIYLPTIDIQPPSDTASFLEQLKNIEKQDWWIFISPQAVYACIDKLQKSVGTQIAAIGEGTAKALQAAGWSVSVIPTEEWNSEGLLKTTAFQDIVDKKIALFRGEGGRELLADALSARGAKITHFIGYRRGLPSIDMGSYLELLQLHKIDIIVCTSGTGMDHLKKLFQTAWLLLQEIPIVVISERMVFLAKELGFQKILLAKNASHSAIMDILGQVE
jgi:uroporphyrinogen-III synthase